MLQELFISNYALIDDLRIDFNTGFSVVTGETGAGKSILLGALGLVTGDRMDKTVLRDTDQKMIIEATFSIHNYNLQDLFKALDLDYAEETIIRREVNTSGKSRSFVNDTPVRLNELNALAEHLLLIHTQHQTSKILQPAEQLNLVDDFLQDQEILLKFTQAYREWKNKEQELQAFKEKINAAQQQLDFLQFQVKEIEESGILQEEHSIEELENILDKIENAQALIEQSNFVVNTLDNDDSGVLEMLKKIRSYLSDMQKYDKDVASLTERINSVLIELNDIYSAVEEHASSLDFDSSEAEQYRSKVNHFNAILQKFHLQDIDAAQEHYQSLKTDVAALNAGDEKVADLESQLKAAFGVANKLARVLTDERKKALNQLCTFVNKEIVKLGMPSAQLSYTITPQDLNKNGLDKIQILFTANKGGAPQPVEKVASGGELSRLMLIVQWYWAMNKKLPTVIFDEIDTGVSGKIAESMANVMVELSQHMQVITITHSPQVAAKGNHHFWVEKFEDQQKTYSRVKKLDHAERIDVIAQMLSGSTISDEAKNNAKMLLA